MEMDDKILERLEEWQQKEGSLPEILKFYRDLLRIQVGARASIPSPQPKKTTSEIDVQLREGIPLLEWNALSVDWSIFQDLFQAVVTTIGEHTNSAAESLREVAPDTSLLQEATRAWYEGSPLSQWADAHGIDEGLLAAAIHGAMKPFLAVQAEALDGLVPQELWRRGYCPICGGKPDFAFLSKGKEHDSGFFSNGGGARWLLCSRCDSKWLFQRLQCPYCNNQSHDALAYFTDDSELYRLYICKRCKSYLKAIDLRRTESEILLPLERVLTVDMDRQGQEEGYRAGWASTAPDEQQ